MNMIEQKFCIALRNYFVNFYGEERGAVNRLAKRLGITQGYLSNILAQRRCPPEGRRREFAAQLGLNYDQMIGVLNIGGIKESKATYGLNGLLSRFENKDLARRCITLMAKIEALDNDSFASIENYLRGMIDALSILKKRKNRTSG